ncbi:beta/gamma crystallin [Methylovirgula ligni]|jgi:hypothetical protein|uniref:Beta/gamma crystallin n=1 Tax=Methylovirgula ligni TaxID=569860 RepID=A0A3D9YYW6_9HYPH|nr:beta/gamma crystallin-related protein [Methylovirgula ligni]REF87953.1 beta/gamma crystallin [Methylovirgula ligni]
MPHIIIFKDADFLGDHKHIFQGRENLQNMDGGFNDTISSFYIVDGYWEFFKDYMWEHPYPLNQTPAILGPGAYPSVTDVLGAGSNDNITGLRPMELVNGVWIPVSLTTPAPVNLTIKKEHTVTARAH